MMTSAANDAFIHTNTHSQAIMEAGKKQFKVEAKMCESADKDVQTKMSLKLDTSTYKSFDLNTLYCSVISSCGIFTGAFS